MIGKTDTGDTTDYFKSKQLHVVVGFFFNFLQKYTSNEIHDEKTTAITTIKNMKRISTQK